MRDRVNQRRPHDAEMRKSALLLEGQIERIEQLFARRLRHFRSPDKIGVSKGDTDTFDVTQFHKLKKFE